MGLRAYVIELVTSDDSGTAVLRDKLKLPSLRDSSAVEFETDPRICGTVVMALAKAQHDSTSVPTSAYILRVGSERYVAWNNEQVGEFFSYYVFDHQMNFLAAFAS